MEPAFYLFTLGCKVNQYESQALREAWTARGLRETDDPSGAAFIVVNSCAVTARAVADLRAAVRRLRRAAPEARLIVTGCAAQALEKSVAELPGVSRVVPQSAKASLLEHPENLDESAPSPAGSPARAPKTPFPPFRISGSRRSRAVLKVQDGCSHGCAYCIVPLARGGAVTRPFAESLAEARRLLEAGFRELVISGVNLRQYRDKSAERGGFWDFLASLDAALAPEWRGLARLRLSSLDPAQLDDTALATLGACHLVAPHLHVSLQSGSPAVLRRMGRSHYDPAVLPGFFERLRAVWPRFGLGADLLSGFPGESAAEFEEGLALLCALPLTYAHVFPYSRRPGTVAAALPDHLGPELKKERSALLRAGAAAKKSAFLRSLLPLESMLVVLEEDEQGQGGGGWRGVNEFYADCRLARGPLPPGRAPRALTPARPLAVEGDTLLAEALP